MQQPASDNSNTNSSQPTLQERHQALVDQLKHMHAIVSPSIEAAFRAVPRHLFLPGTSLEDAYTDKVIGTKMLDGQCVSSSSQPAIMAVMLEQLQLQPGQSVLEIGAGTGYNAALMAHIVGETGRVVTIDIDEDIVEAARDHLAAAGFERVQVVCGDGGLGYVEAAPYDRIILTVNSNDILPAFYEQLQPNGRLLLPLTIRGPQVCAAFEWVGEREHLESVSVRVCSFMTLRGAFAAPNNYVQLDPEPDVVSLGLSTPRPVDASAIARLLDGPTQEIALPLQVSRQQAIWEIGLWLALHEPGFCYCFVNGPACERVIFSSFLYSMKKNSMSMGLLDESSLCLLILASATKDTSPSTTVKLAIRNFGPDDALARRLAACIQSWEDAGHPSERRMHISAYPGSAVPATQEGDFVVDKPYTQIVCRW